MRQGTKQARLYCNGTILTINRNQPYAEALLEVDGKIAAVGSREEAAAAWEALRTNGAYSEAEWETVDLKGRTLMPGFYDGHSHIAHVCMAEQQSVDLSSPPLGNVRNLADCVRVLKERGAEKGKELGFIGGGGFSESDMEEQRPLTRKELDQVSSEIPVLVMDRSMHVGYVNSRVLELLGIDENTPDPEGGRIVREEGSRRPNGVLMETALRSASLAFKKLFPLYAELNADAVDVGTYSYAKVGVTTANDGSSLTNDERAHYLRAYEQGKLHTRVIFQPFWPMRVCGDQDFLDEVRAAQKQGYGTSWLKMGGVKCMDDGAIQTLSAYLSQPYFCDPENHGIPTYSKETLMRELSFIAEQDFQILIHCNGDQAAEDVLDVLETVEKRRPGQARRLRHTIIHAQTIREDQLDRVQKLGMVLSLFPPHIYYFGDRHVSTFLGPDRAKRISPARSAMERGIPFSIHCDSPIFPQNPLQTIWSIVNRVTYGGMVLGAEQCVPVEEALRAYTIYAAYEQHEDQERGSLETGKYADMVILSENPMTCDPMAIKDIQVLETIVEGQTTYRASEG